MEIETDNREEMWLFTRSSPGGQSRPQPNPPHPQPDRLPGGSPRAASEVPDNPREWFEERKDSKSMKVMNSTKMQIRR
jgi:hypothetical protein